MKTISTHLGIAFRSVLFCTLLCASTAVHSQDILLGLTQSGGLYNKGVPYQIGTNGTGFISYGDFDGDNGEQPGNGAAFVQVHNGIFSALTESGDQQMGIGTRVNIMHGEGGLLPKFGFQFSQGGSGTNPTGRFLVAADGWLYGLTSANSSNGAGALFTTYTITGNGINGTLPFDGPTTGRNPKGSLIQASNGKLYGMTEIGGNNDLGVIFLYDNTALIPEFKKILDFNGTANGSNPTGNLLEASDGKLYGMTRTGGTNGQGVIFSVQKDGTGYTKLLNFNASATGSEPLGSLVLYTDGKLYGMTSKGGANGFGTIFSITTGGVFTKIIDFNGTNGKTPVGDLLVAPSGTVMYGTTFAGGVNDKGVLFKIENGNQFTKLYDYNATTGGNPVGSLAMMRQNVPLTFPPIPEKTTLSAPFTPTVESTSGMPIYFLSSDPSVAVIENNQVKIVGTGGTRITAFQLGNHGYVAQSAEQVLSVRKASQTITFGAIPSKTFGDPPFTISATSSSGLPVSFINQSLVLINGNTVTVAGGGTGQIMAMQEGNSVYEAAPNVTQQFFIERAEQTITFSTPSVRVCCQGFSLNASSSALLDVSFKTPDRDKLRISNSYAEPIQLGSVDVVAYHPGNSNYKPAEAHAPLTILKGDQTIYFYPLNMPFKLGDPPAYFTAGANSGLPVTFTSDPPGIAVAEAGILYFLGVGTTTITATQGGNQLYNAAAPVSQTLTVNPPLIPATGNTITWPDLFTRTAADPPFNLIASASSGLPVSYMSTNPDVATVVGNKVTIHGVGTTTITASQPGNTTIPAALSVSKELQIVKQAQVINFPYIGSVGYGSEPLALPIYTYQGLPIVYTSSDNNIASVVNYGLYFNGSGVVTITASQPGDEKHFPANEESRIVTVYPEYQTLTFTKPSLKTFGDAPFSLVASASSGLAVTFTSSDPAIASISGSKVTIKSAGTVTITAKQSGYPGHYAVELSHDLVINKAPQTITFPALANKQFGDPPFLLSATSSSKLPVVFSSATPAISKVSGNVVSIMGSGTGSIIASQAGNDNFLPAENVTREFQIADIDNIYNLVGSTHGGGPNGSGVVYKLNSDGSGFNILKGFDVRTSPNPQAGFIKGTDGKLYGNFNWGGQYNNGRVVRLDADGTNLTVLHHFNHAATGSSPFGNLIQGNNGYLYGMTRSGGSNGSGTIFRVNTDATDFSILYHFNPTSGGSSLGGLVQASNGKLYGVAQNGGFFGSGTIFSIDADGSNFSVIFHCDNNAPLVTGTYSRGDLVEGPDGFLYGTMMQGGANNKGTLFKIKTDGTGFAKILDFDGVLKGASPSSTMLIGSDGKIYGMTQRGGTNDLGTLFYINTNGTGYTKLVDFDGTTKGSYPAGKLAEGSDGALYGMTNSGGVNGVGVAFKVNKNGSGFHKMADFNSNASSPVFGPLVESTPGTFVGMTSTGGSANGGAIFKITSADVFTIIGDFPQSESIPRNLITDATGQYYYGIAVHGGVNGNGTIFRIKASNSLYERILDLPAGLTVTRMFYMSTGHLWCTGTEFGSNVVFRIKTDGTGLQTLIVFDDPVQKGTAPLWLLEASNGTVYGTAYGTGNSGLTYKIKNDGTQFSKLVDIPSGEEINPGQFIEGSDGNFYICSAYNSNLYRFTPAGSITKIFTFPEEAGEVPMKIIELNGGALGVITRDHGSGNYGSIFSVEKDGTGYAKIFNPKESDGVGPMDMIQSADGWFFVAAQYGGTYDKGVVYKVKGDGSSFIKLKEFQGNDGDIPNSLFFLKTPQSFTCDAIPQKKTSDPPFVPTAVSTSGIPVKFSSSNPTVAVVENGLIKPLKVGSTTITARLPANANFYAAPGIEERTLVVVKGDQTITFEPLSPVTVETQSFELTAISSSGLPISYVSSNTSVATISGATLTIRSAGTTTITGLQSGDDNFYAAPNVQQVLVVNANSKDPQLLQFTNPGTKTLGGNAFHLTATTSSNLPILFSSNSDKIILNGSQVSMIKAGSVTIDASQPGNDDFQPATPVSVLFCINPPQPTITQTGTAPNLTLHSSHATGNQWYVNEAIIAGATGATFTISSGGSYSVVTTVDGCASIASDPVLINITGVEHFPELRLDILPNPTNAEIYVTIEGHFSSAVTLELVDAMGRTVETKNVTEAGTTKFDLRSHGDGLYLMKATLGGKMIVRRVIKE